MAQAGTVFVEITREQAEVAASWLLNDYKPGNAPPGAGDRWHAQQIAIAHTIGAKLDKAARRRRQSNILKLKFQREDVQWLAAFMSEEQGWWVFTWPGTKRDVFLWAQPSPAPIRQIAALFLKGASFRQGRSEPKLEEIERRLDRLPQDGSSDERWQRRLKNKKRDLELAREVTAAAKRMIKKST